MIRAARGTLAAFAAALACWVILRLIAPGWHPMVAGIAAFAVASVVTGAARRRKPEGTV